MNIISCNIRYTSPISFPRNQGFSKSADDLQKETEELQENFTRNMTFGDHFSKMLEDLLKVEQEYSVDDWDGYNAKAIDSNALENAKRFALSLPLNIPIPEIYGNPNGEVMFEWYEGKRKVFSVSVGSNSALSYAGLYGYNKTHGIEHFYDDIPDFVLSNINRLYAE